VCLSVYWTLYGAVRKGMNRSRRRFGYRCSLSMAQPLGQLSLDAKSSTGVGWEKAGASPSAGWQATPCDLVVCEFPRTRGNGDAICCVPFSLLTCSTMDRCPWRSGRRWRRRGPSRAGRRRDDSPRASPRRSLSRGSAP